MGKLLSVDLLVILFSTLSSSPLSPSDDESELEEDSDVDEDSEDEEDEDELELEELDDNSEDPECGFLVLCRLRRRFLGLGCLEGSQQSQ